MGQLAACPDKLGRLGRSNLNVYAAVCFPVKLIRARGSPLRRDRTAQWHAGNISKRCKSADTMATLELVSPFWAK